MIVKRIFYTLYNIVVQNWSQLKEDWLIFVSIILITDFKNVVLSYDYFMIRESKLKRRNFFIFYPIN